MIRTRLIGTGHYVPDKILTNDDISKMVETSDEWIRTRTGIRERRIMADGQVTSDMAVEAAKMALERAGRTTDDVDLLVVATVTPDMPMPSCAVMVQHKLGAKCPAFDLSAACAGFSYGLTVVDGLVRSKDYKTVLFIGAEALSRFLDFEDRTTCILFGDGAGAVVCTGEEQAAAHGDVEARGVLATTIAADGSMWAELNVKGGGTQHPPTAQTVADGLHAVRMNGRAIFGKAVRWMSEACEQVLEKVGMEASEVDLIIPHQANLRIIDAIGRRLGLTEGQVVVNLDRFGNTSAASIPIALSEAVESGRLTEGMTVLMCGLGGGLTWGATLIRW
jgi:3-oxoacyl-[acyl-carrier-protein] synthase-3